MRNVKGKISRERGDPCFNLDYSSRTTFKGTLRQERPARASEQSYNVILKAKPGVEFVVGKTYRLCIGGENPEEVSIHSSNYRCTADYEFKLD